MANETKGLDALDPLARFSVLSLFPRTLGGLQTSPQPSDLEQNLDLLHGHVKSLVFRSPKKLVDQAKAVMEENNKQLNNNVPRNAPSRDNSVFIVAADDNPKKRRVGLDRKRPHFSLKPDFSESTVNLEPSFNIDNYEDPDDFFAAFGKFEHTKKEIQKQSGFSQKDNVHFTSSQVRTRRPGLGRSYKHLFSESDILPQEVLAKNTNAPSNVDLQESVELNIPSKEQDMSGSEKVDKGIGLLNELLSENLEDLEGDGAINLVQKHLQMENFSIQTLCLPEMQNVRMVCTKASVGNSIKPRRALADIQNLSKGVISSSDGKHSGTGSSKGYLSFKKLPKSPHAQVTMLKKLLFDANSCVDPFSSIYVDEVDAHSEDVNISNNTCISGKLRSPVTIVDDNAAYEVGTSGATQHSVHTHDDTVSLNFNQECSRGAGSIHINDALTHTISGFHIDQTVDDDDMNISDSSLDVLGQAEGIIPSESMENLNIKENTITTDLEEPPICSIIQEQPKDGTSKGADSAPDQQVEEPTQAPPNGRSKGKLGTRKRSKRKAPSSEENPEDISNPATESANAALEEPLEETPREIPNEESKLEQRKQKQQRMKLDSSRRQSLSGAGTKWEKCKLKKGEDESEKVVRRSTRIRSRPLAYWKGERFLYGRVHQSLATVIGVKSFGSPGDDGKPCLKVKSFVDDKFNDLVKFAGLH